MSPHVAGLERDVERLNDDREFLRGQIRVKDSQIASLHERDREAILIRDLQEMLTPSLARFSPTGIAGKQMASRRLHSTLAATMAWVL